MSRKWGLRFEKSEWVEFCRRKKKVDFRLLAEALWRVRTWFGADGKVSRERWHLSPYVEKPLNSKVIKSFVPELRSRKWFSCFGILMLSIYELWTFYVHFTYHVFMYGYVTTDVSTLSSILASPFSPFFFLKPIVCLSHLWDIRPNALSWVFCSLVHFLKFFHGPLQERPFLISGGRFLD